MAKNDDLSAQATLEQSINDSIAQRAGLLKQMNAEMSAQLQMQLEICKACESGPDYSEQASQMGELNDALSAGADSANKGASAQSALGKAAGGAGDGAKKAAKGFEVLGAAAVGAMAGAVSGAKKAVNQIKSMGGALKSVAGTAKKLAMSAFSGLSGSLSWLAGEAQAGAGGADAIGNAFEKLKGTVGGAGKEFDAAHGAIDQLRSGAATASMAGINMASIYGRGSGGVAAAIEDVGKIMGEAGNQVGYLTEALEKNAGGILMANKALGLTGDSLAALAKNATLTGQDVGGFTDKVNLQTAYMSKKFGINVKKMGKNIGEMTKDFATFGTMTPKELATTAAYADKLGISIKGLQGITAKTDDFEGAAMAAAELAGSFGMAIDAQELMTADPAEKAEMVRKAFAETGKDFAEMSRQEKARMAEITGMGADELAGMFDPSKADIGLDDMAAAAEEAENGAMTQAEANKELSKSISKLIDSMGGMTKMGGPLDALIKGFGVGIKKSPQFRKLLSNLRKSMKIMYDLGRYLGQMFVDLFPGVEKLIGGFAELFSPKRFGIFAMAIKDAFDAFKKGDLTAQGLMKKIKSALSTFFGAGGDAMKTIKEGALEMINGFVEVLKFLLPMAIDQLIKLVDGIIGFLSGDGKKAIADGGKKGFGAGVLEALMGLWKAIEPKLGELAKKLGEMFKLLWEKHGDKIKGAMMAVASFVIGQVFLGAITGALTGGIVGKIGSVIKKKLGKIMTGSIDELAPNNSKAMAKGMEKLATNFGDDAARLGAKAGSALSKVAGPLMIAGLGLSMSKMRDTMGEELTALHGETDAKMGMLGAGVVDFITFGLLPDSALTSLAGGIAKLSDLMGTFMESIGLGGLHEYVTTQLASVFDVFAGIGDVIMGIFSKDSDKSAAGFKSILDGIRDMVTNFIFVGLPAILIDLPIVIASTLQDVGLWILKFLVADLPQMLLSGIIGLFKGVGAYIGESAYYLYKFFTDGEFQANAIAEAQAWVTGIVGKIVGFFVDSVDKFIQFPIDVFNSWVEFFDGETGGLASDIIDGIVGGLGSLGDMLKAPFVAAWDGIKGVFGIASPSKKAATMGADLIDGLMGSLGAIPQKLLDVFKQGLDWVIDLFGLDALQPIVDSVFETMEMVVSSITEPLEAAAEALLNIIIWPWTTAYDVLSQIFTGDIPGAIDTFVSAITTQFNNIRDFIVNMADAWINYITWPFQAAVDFIYKMLPQGMKDTVDEAWAFITGVFDQATDLGANIVDGILLGLGDLTSLLSAPFTDAWSGIKGVFGIASPSAEGEEAGGSITDGMVDGLKKLPEQMMSLASEALDYLLSAFDLDHLRPLIDNIVGTFIAASKEIGAIFKKIGGKILEPMKAAFGAIMTFAQDVFSGKGIKKSFKKMVKKVKMSLKDVIKVFKELGPKAIAVFTNMLDDIYNLLDEYFDMDAIKEKMEGMLKGIKAAAGKVKDMIAGPFEAAWKVVSELMSFDSMKTSGESMIRGIGEGLTGLAGKVLEFASAGWTTLTNHFNWGLMQEAGLSMVRGIASGLSNLGSTLYDLAVDAVSQLMNPFEGSPIDAPTAPSGEIGSGLKDGVMKGISSLPEELKAAGGDAMKALEDGMGANGSGNEAMIQAVIAPVSDAISAVQQAQNSIHEILNKLEPIDLDATIQRTADELAVKNKTVSIQHKPVTITVNMNVTMSAEDIATALVEGKYVMQGDDSTPPGQ